MGGDARRSDSKWARRVCPIAGTQKNLHAISITYALLAVGTLLAIWRPRDGAGPVARQTEDIAMLNLTNAVAERPPGRRWLAAAAGLALGLTAALPARAEDTIKVGILHSLSGTMAISETTLKDVVLMLIDEQNKKGGVLGKKLEAVVVDPASNWPLFAEKARELISKDKVAVVFGCWTSVSRKSVLPVFKELNSILFYPVQYEGEESERNVFYTGAAPNQQAIPAVEYLASPEGGNVKRWVLEGTDYVYPRTTNKILEAYLKDVLKVAPEDIMINYTPFGFSDWQTEVSKIKAFGSAGKKTAVVSTINGDANVPFYKELGNQGIKATDIPVVAFSVGEEELAGLDTKPLVGHLAAWNYFESIKTPANEAFIKEWHEFTKNPKRTTNDPMEAHVIGFAMWVKAVEKVKSTDPDKVIEALPGTKAPNLTGGISELLPNHHITKPVFIGEIRPDGQFDVVWKTKGLVPGAAWSAYLPGSKDLIGDWVTLKCGNYNTVTKKCGGAS
jgi:urea transport system substrate-binding protein